eukprot:2113779-Rhodomonas_salina.2
MTDPSSTMCAPTSSLSTTGNSRYNKEAQNSGLTLHASRFTLHASRFRIKIQGSGSRTEGLRDQPDVCCAA